MLIGKIFKYKPICWVLFIFCFLLAACERKHDKEEWVQGTATITVESLEDKNYGYTIQYDVPESTAVNADHKPIKGSISQYGLSARKPINRQKLKIRYMRNEPVIFELLEPIQYEK